MHGRTVCQHGIVHSQCRCMEGHKNTTVIQCDRNEEHRQMTPQVDTRELDEALVIDRDNKIENLKEQTQLLQYMLDRLSPCSDQLALVIRLIKEL